MPLDRLVLIVFLALAAAAATVWLATVVSASSVLPIGAGMLLPALLVGYVVWRVVADRPGATDDDVSDRID